MSTFENCLALLQSDFTTDREKGKKLITDILKTGKSSDIDSFILNGLKNTLTFLNSNADLALLLLIKEYSSINQSVFEPRLVCRFINFHLTNPNLRIRTECSEILKILSNIDPKNIFNNIFDLLINIIQKDIENDSNYDDNKLKDSLLEDTIILPVNYLETSLKALHSILSQTIKIYAGYISKDVLKIILQCSSNKNMFIREMSLKILSELFSICYYYEFLNDQYIFEIVSSVFACLNDDSPEVRFCASIAARRIFISLPKKDFSAICDMLLPSICFNRHYSVDSIANYNVETWEIVTEGNGIQLISQTIDKFIDYYICQIQNHNEELQISANLCLVEICCLLTSYISNSQLTKIYDSILLDTGENYTFKDPLVSALGYYILYFPNFFDDKINFIVEALLKKLNCKISSQMIKEKIAIALACILNINHQTLYQKITDYFDSYLLSACKQPIDNIATDLYKIVTFDDPRDDPEFCSHNDQKMYSCCSLSFPSDIAISDNNSKPNKDLQRWRQSHNCLLLIGEICKFYTKNFEFPFIDIALNKNCIDIMKKTIISSMESISSIIQIRTYPEYIHLLNTFLTYLPYICKFIGIELFMQYYIDYFDTVIRVCVSDKANRYLLESVTNCIEEFEKINKINILKFKI